MIGARAMNKGFRFVADATRDYFRPLERLAGVLGIRRSEARTVRDSDILGSFLSDQPDGLDQFGREKFSATIARALMLPDAFPGLVVGLDGIWGSGKTFVIRCVLADLRNATPDPIVVEFSPWLISGANTLVEALLEQLSAAISLKSPESRTALRASESLLNYLALIRHLKYLKYVPGVTAAGTLIDDVAQWAERFGNAARGAGADLGKVSKDVRTHDLNKVRKKVEAALATLGRPLVVVIDDIDRLPHSEIRSLMQAIKAVANFPRTAYLLAYDSAAVSAALSAESIDGRKYIEKIVQVEYQLPKPLLWRMRRFLESNLQKAFEGAKHQLTSDEAGRWDEAVSYANRLTSTPRDAIRISNRLRISLPATRGEVEATDVVVYEALSICAPEIAALIRDHPDAFVSTPDLGFEEFDMQFYFARAASEERGKSSAGERWESLLPESTSEYVRGALKFLFGSDRKRALRISNWDRLYRLLALGPDEFLTEVEDLRVLLADFKELRIALSSDDASVLSILRGIQSFRDELRIQSPDEYVRALCEAASARLQGPPNWRDLAEQYAHVLEGELRRDPSFVVQRLQDIVRLSPLSISEPLVLQASIDLGLWAHRSNSAVHPTDRLVTTRDTYEIVLSCWLERVRSTSVGELAKEPRLISVLYRWGQLSDDFSEARKAAEGLVKRFGKLQEFVEGIGSNNEMPVELSAFDLVWDRGELLDLVEDDAARYKYTIDTFERPDVIEYFNSRTDEPSVRLRSSKADDP